MKSVFLLIVLALLLPVGFAQAPDGASNAPGTDNVKGCLGGSDGNYTVAEDSTDQILKITTTSVELKPHLGHHVELIGHKTSGTTGSGAADNSFTVTELNMISEHCGTPAAAAAAASVATASPSPETVIPPAADATAPSATVTPSSATAGTSAADTGVPVETVNQPSATVSTPAVETPATAATVGPSPETVSTPTANVAQSTRPSTHARRLSATQAAAVTAPAATVSSSSATVVPSAADAATPAATATPSSDTVSPPAAAVPAPTVTHRGWPLWLLISGVVLVIVLGTLVPVLGRWRKQKILQETAAENLSFTNEVSTDQDKPEPSKAA
jgi:hypothetical protein